MADALPPDFISIILAGSIAVAMVVLLVSTRQFFQFVPYAYPNARVMARKANLLDRKQMTEIIEAKKTEEAYTLVEEVPEYKKFMEKYPFEKAMNMQMAETHELLARISPNKFKEFFEIVLSRWDIQNIKTIIVAKEMGVDIEEIKDSIIPFGILKTDVLERLIDSENIDEIVEDLKNTDYYEIIQNSIPLYREKGTILPIEAALDKYYYKQLLETISDISKDKDMQVLYSMISTQIDVINLIIILRTRADSLEFKDIEDYLIPGGHQLSQWKLKDLLDSEKTADFVNNLEGTDYVEVIRENIPEYEKTGSISSLESALDRYNIELGSVLAKKRPSTIGPLFSFLSHKETEIKNLKIILRAKEEGFPPKTISTMISGGLT